MKSAVYLVGLNVVGILVSKANGLESGFALPCRIDEVYEVALSPEPVQSIPYRRNNSKFERPPLITALVEPSGPDGGYYGLNNQREALQNMLLTAYAMGADILLPPSGLLLSFDPRPKHLVEQGMCDAVGNETAKYEFPWDFVDAVTETVGSTQYGAFGSLWNENGFKRIAFEAFGVRTSSHSCEDYRHVRLNVLEDWKYETQFEETIGPFADRYSKLLQAWIDGIDSYREASTTTTNSSDDREIVYHLNLGYEVLMGSLTPCQRIFTPWQCNATDEALQFAVPIKTAASAIVSSLRQIATSSGNDKYDVAHYHDMFCRNREYLFHLMAERDVNNTTPVVYNIGNPPELARGLSKKILDPSGCARRPFQVNAAIEFEVARSARGVVFGSEGSTFDAYLKQYRDLRKLETVIIGKMPNFGDKNEEMGTRTNPCRSNIQPRSRGHRH